MKLLLDTHVFLWSLLAPANLSQRVKAELENPANEMWLSPLSIWEVLVLTEKGRIRLEPNPNTWIQQVLQAIPFFEAPVTFGVASESRRIDLPHQDPVDRFLAATAALYELTLVTADEHLLKSRRYAVLAAR